MIKAGVNTTINEAENDYFGDAKTVDVRYVQIPYTSIADSLVQVKKSDVKDTVRPLSINSVGRYALSIKFSDGHQTGIYTFKMLHQL